MTTPLGTLPPSNHPDRYVNVGGYVPQTDYATGYLSRHTGNHMRGAALPCLANLNCSYLTPTSGRAPTLVALKRHAQALAVLIRSLTVSTTMGEIDNASKDDGARAFQPNDAFDWLNDLDKPYENTDPSHHLPLNTVLNQVRGQTDEEGPKFHCPLHETPPAEDGEKPPAKDGSKGPMDPVPVDPVVKPYSTHHNLLMHASECLEILDHEFSATGGIMSVLPTDSAAESTDMRSARNSLVGQLLLFTQQLVARTHELELSYGKSLDLVADEVVVAAQLHGRLGPVGAPAMGGGRPVVYPQDKWILANAGEAVHDHLHRLFDVQEGQYSERERIWRDAGASGQKMWMEERGGEEWSRGIVTLDVVTRYYRLKGSGHGTVFLIPGWEFHPRCTQTARNEKTPKIVSVPAPLQPTRVSDWEARHRKKLLDGDAARAEVVIHTKIVNDQKREIEFLKTEVRTARDKLEGHGVQTTG
ncbi:hypothetical protein IMZ48_39255 [Candidatus Bathyarchaeota archaeon]|nr:hypothetical protein [Candidatus Bathyarchaeota archaeon]